MLTLYIGNKNYSSWSMRPWVLLKQAGIAFTEVRVRFDSFDVDSVFKKTLRAVTPTGRVPVLVDGDLAIWDSLAIAEYLAEQYPEKNLWPADKACRAHARSICAELHADFTALRTYCPMNIEAHLPQAGALVWRDQSGVRANAARLVDMWGSLLNAHGGPMLFGDFSVADAFYAPVCSRFKTYDLPVPDGIRAYIDRVLALPGVAAWMGDALIEKDFRPFGEPYRLEG